MVKKTNNDTKTINKFDNEKKRTFTFKYDPTISLEKMGQELQEVVKTGKSNLHLHQISFANIEDITSEFVSPRPKLFACLVEKNPESLYQLAKLLKRDYANVHKDVKSLVAMGIIKLEKGKERVIPIPLYDQIFFDFKVKEIFPHSSEKVLRQPR
jgi:predicted transcriptional regulator